MADLDGDKGSQISPQLVADSCFYEEGLELRELFSIPWGHVRLLIDKCKGDRDKALFYVHKTVENG